MIKKYLLFGTLIFILTFTNIKAYSNTKDDLYIRILSEANINLLSNQRNIDFNADKFFEALKSDSEYNQYIAINRLVECFNDDYLTQKAIEQIQPFTLNSQKKIAASALFAIDILSRNYKSDRLYKLADGNIYFTLFNNYSDYGSYNEIWRIKDDKLEKYTSFQFPLMYINEIIPSPDKSLIAVTACSNKSNFITIFDPINSIVSSELVGSARVVWGAKKGYNTFIRSDNENYCSISNVSWKDNQQLSFDVALWYYDLPEPDDQIIQNVNVNYNFDKKAFDIIESSVNNNN